MFSHHSVDWFQQSQTIGHAASPGSKFGSRRGVLGHSLNRLEHDERVHWKLGSSLVFQDVNLAVSKKFIVVPSGLTLCEYARWHCAVSVTSRNYVWQTESRLGEAAEKLGAAWLLQDSMGTGEWAVCQASTTAEATGNLDLPFASARPVVATLLLCGESQLLPVLFYSFSTLQFLQPFF